MTTQLSGPGMMARFRRRGVVSKVTTLVPSRKLNKRQKSQVKRIITRGMEKKFFPIYQSSTSVSSAGTIIDLTQIPQGDTGLTRDGQRIELKEIRIRAYFTVSDQTNIGRLIIFQWHPSDTSGAPSVAQIIQDTTNNSWISPVQFFSKRFRVLYDTFVSMSSLSDINSRMLNIRIFPKKFNSQISFETGVNTGVNHIYACVLSDSTAATHPTFNMHGYLKYTDA